MKEEHVKIFTGSTIIVSRLQTILKEHGIDSIVKSDKIPAYEITNYIDELHILNLDLEKATPIVEDFKKEIA